MAKIVEHSIYILFDDKKPEIAFLLYIYMDQKENVMENNIKYLVRTYNFII